MGSMPSANVSLERSIRLKRWSWGSHVLFVAVVGAWLVVIDLQESPMMVLEYGNGMWEVPAQARAVEDDIADFTRESGAVLACKLPVAKPQLDRKCHALHRFHGRSRSCLYYGTNGRHPALSWTSRRLQDGTRTQPLSGPSFCPRHEEVGHRQRIRISSENAAPCQV